MNKYSDLKWFARISLLEGISFVILLLIAMPLKYFYDQPLAVKYVGMAHGLLFVLYLMMLIYVGNLYKWKFSKIALYGLCSFLPLAPFWVERQVNKEIKTLTNS